MSSHRAAIDVFAAVKWPREEIRAVERNKKNKIKASCKSNTARGRGAERGAFRHIVGERRGLVGSGSRSANCVCLVIDPRPMELPGLHLHASESQRQKHEVACLDDGDGVSGAAD